MKTYCLSLKITKDDRDRALALAAHHGTLGCCEEETEGEVRLECYFGNMTDALAAEYCLMDLRPVHPVKFSVVPQQNWNARWRRNMRPARLTENIWAAPRWLRPPLGRDDKWIIIEPKMAFGSGHHESTRLAAWGIKKLGGRLAAGSVGLDIGTGSGVLCFAAGILGAGFCIGIDKDLSVAQNLAENRRANSQVCRSAFIIGTLEALKTTPRFDFACMNMILTESAPLLKMLHALLKAHAWLVWSGLLGEEREQASARAAGAGFTVRHEQTENEWWACVLGKG
jgi:ribosomal protein L11 methyltransferase